MITTKQLIWKNSKEGWQTKTNNTIKPKLGLIFTSRLIFEKDGLKAIENLKKSYPNTTFVTATSAGNIVDTEVHYNVITLTLIEFEKTELEIKSFSIPKDKHTDFGKQISESFVKDKLKLLFLLSTSSINAGHLVNGINEGFNKSVIVTGGVAGDGERFEKTLVGIDKKVKTDNVVAIGLYSDSLEVSFGSKGGWVPFGPPRIITKAKQNELFEIDGKPALSLYKEYLGNKAKDLPSSALLFPIGLIENEQNDYVIRGIQNINEKNNSIILYSDVQENQEIRLMRANHTALIDGAGESAQDTLSTGIKPQLSILVSCIARHLVLGQLIEEEIEEIRDVVGDKTDICGFYSYSEFSPLKGETSCALHNQTMTITSLSEK
ncbi:MAG TPA: histidine kinase [Crocinitomix sp.]|nr:histidine kinase [Crocinitomix sp.]